MVGSQRMAAFDDLADRKLTVYDKGFDPDAASIDDYVARSGETRSPAIGGEEPLRIELEHFVDCVAGDRTPRTDGRSGVRVVRVLDALQHSLDAGGSTVELARARLYDGLGTRSECLGPSAGTPARRGRRARRGASSSAATRDPRRRCDRRRRADRRPRSDPRRGARSAPARRSAASPRSTPTSWSASEPACRPRCYLTRGTVIEDDVFIGPGATLTNDNTMGRHASGEALLRGAAAPRLPDRRRRRALPGGRDRRGGLCRSRRCGRRRRRPAHVVAGVPAREIGTSPTRTCSSAGGERVSIPLFATRAAAGAAARRGRRAPARRPRVGQLHPRPRGRGLRGGVRRLRRRPPLRRGRQRHRCADDRPARARGRRRGRGRRPRTDLLRDRRGGGQRGRRAGLLRRRPANDDDDRGDGRGGDRSERTPALLPVHLFGNPAPMAELRELAGDGTAPARGRRAGGRRDARRSRRRAPSATPPPSASSPRRTWAGSATAARSSPTTTRSPPRPGGSERMARRTAGPTPRSATTRASTSSRPHPCGSCSRISASGPPPVDVSPNATTSGLGEVVALPVETDGAESCFHLYVVRCARRDELAVGSRRGLGSRHAPITRCRCTASRPWPRYAPAGPLPVSETAAAESLALPIGPALRRGADAVDRVVDAVSRDEGPDRRRQPAAVRQGGRGLPAPAGAGRRDARPHRPALRPRALGGLLRGARHPAARSRPRGRLGHPRGADGDDDGPPRAGPRPRSRPSAMLVYGDTNATLAAALVAAKAGYPGRPRRGGDALLRPHDARGGQPARGRPARRAPALLDPDRARQPAARGAVR